MKKINQNLSASQISASYKHTLFEDITSIAIGIMMIAFGILVYKENNIVVGGKIGIVLITSYLTGFTTGTLLFLFNLPFYLGAVPDNTKMCLR